VPTAQALAMAEEAGLDLVEISPNTEPPVCKILDLGKLKYATQKKAAEARKLKYATQKKAAEARKKQKIIEIKEIKMRPNIDTHDYEVKMKAIQRFFEDGDKVKVTLKFRGREMAHLELGMKLLLQVKDDTTAIAKVEAEPKLEGRQMMMVLAPK
jgi:translation initiation factor IF-3